jgi:hypothetical protein
VGQEAVKKSLHDQHRQECLCHNLRELNGFRVAQAFLPVLVFDFSQLPGNPALQPAKAAPGWIMMWRRVSATVVIKSQQNTH